MRRSASPAALTNAGSILCSEGTCDFFGDVTNVGNQPTTGRIVITANSQATFFDDVVNQGTIQVSAAGIVESTALFLGSLTGNGVTGSGSVFLEGDVRSRRDHRHDGVRRRCRASARRHGRTGTRRHNARQPVSIGSPSAQSLALSGTLDVTLAGGFTPAAGQSFDLFDWGTRSGTFASINLPALARPRVEHVAALHHRRAERHVRDSRATSTATAPSTPPTTPCWRDGLGSIYTQTDYDVWKSHFGQTTGSGAVASGGSNDVVAVPEPGAGWLLFCGAAALYSATRRQACKTANRRKNSPRTRVFDGTPDHSRQQ